MFHFVELPLRHIYYHYDGEPKGPIGPVGEIGSRIKYLNDNLFPFVDYQTIQCNIQFVPRELFRKKQDLIVLYDLVLAVINGVGSVDPVYLTKKLSEISTVRWNTTFSRHSDPKLGIHSKIEELFLSLMSGSCHLDSTLNVEIGVVKYWLLLSFLTAAKFYDLGDIQGIIRVH